MPEEVFGLAVISIFAATGLIIFLAVQISSYMKSRHGGTTGSNSLGKSELETMLRRVVREELSRADSPASRGAEKFLLNSGEATLDAQPEHGIDEYDEERLRNRSGT